MTVSLNGKSYYRTAEACGMAGISRNTFLRWVREGVYADVELRDRKGWRLFTENDVIRLQAETNKTQVNNEYSYANRQPRNLTRSNTSGIGKGSKLL